MTDVAYKAKTTYYLAGLQKKLAVPWTRGPGPALMGPGGHSTVCREGSRLRTAQTQRGGEMTCSKGIALAAVQTRMTAGKTSEG